MPIYTYHCPSCGRDADQFARVADRDANAPACCGAAMARKLSAPMVQVPGGDVSYKCPMTGEVVKSMRRRQYLMEQQGVVDARDFKESWAKADAKRKAERAEAKAAYDAIPDKVKQAAQATGPLAA